MKQIEEKKKPKLYWADQFEWYYQFLYYPHYK